MLNCTTSPALDMMGVSQTPGVTKEILNLSPFFIPPDSQQKQKDKTYILPASSFTSATPGKKKLIY